MRKIEDKAEHTECTCVAKRPPGVWIGTFEELDEMTDAELDAFDAALALERTANAENRR